MVVGHYTTALVAKRLDPRGPLWLFLLASMFLDFLMAGLVVSGIETMRPDPAVAGPRLASMVVEMTYSHDLIPAIGWGLALGALALAGTRSRGTALWVAGLVFVHEVFDLVSGFPHFVMGSGTPEVGFGLYQSAPLMALAIEAVVAFACVFYFLRRSTLTTAKKAGLLATTLFGILVMIPGSI